MGQIRALAAGGPGVIFTTHDPNHAARHADRVALLDGGRPVAAGRPADVLTQNGLAALYRAPVDVVGEAAGPRAFLPGA